MHNIEKLLKNTKNKILNKILLLSYIYIIQFIHPVRIVDISGERKKEKGKKREKK